MFRFVPFLMLFVMTATSVIAQTPEQVAAEPIVKLQPGETAVPGQCLTQQELDLIEALNALRRPTVGQESEGDYDDQAPFDPGYFVGAWEIEGVLPESPLGPAGEFYGTETVRHVEGCTYESVIEATTPDGTVTITSLVIYDRRARYMVRLENDSRGFQLAKVGPVAGDPGGYSSHHWQAPAITHQGSTVRLSGRTFVTSPYAFEVRRRIAVDDGEFANFGTVRWERVDE